MKLFQPLPPSRGESANRDCFDSLHTSHVICHLLPKLYRLRSFGDGIHNKQSVRRKACRLLRQSLKGCDEKSRHKEHKKTERHLHGNQRVHQPPLRMWIIAALQRADRIDRRGAQRGNQSKKQSHEQRERQTESQEPANPREESAAPDCPAD